MIFALISLSVALLVCVAAVVAVNRKLTASETARATAEQRAAVAETALDYRTRQLEGKLADREAEFGRQKADYEAMMEKRLSDARQSVSDSFRAMATDTLDATVKKHGEVAARNLEAAMAPMRDAFEKMSQEFMKRTIDTSNERTLLQDGINSLKALNMQVCDETRRLSVALRGNTGFQGRWGEMVLENILEGSGLEKSRWVVYQESTTTESGERVRPDAVIHCPRGRDIVIDSKVSLKAYLGMAEATDETARAEYRDEHLHSIENHLRGLGNKEYQSRVGTGKAGFVLMFIPHEGAYMAAMQANPDLWQRAYDRHVVIVSPTHLVTVVRLVEQMWQTEDQTANSLAIAEEATKMLDKLNDFLGDIVAIENSIAKAAESVASARKRLSTGNGNVIKRAENLRAMGIKTKKNLIHD